jgi:hypothetical protein
VNPIAQRIAIAEVGRKWFKWGDAPGESNRFLVVPKENNGSFLLCDKPSHGIPCNLSELPDYLNDLNAMHEAEEKLNNSKDGSRFGQILASIVLGLNETEIITLNAWAAMRLARATSSQRAEAFLKTLNLWNDEK